MNLTRRIQFEELVSLPLSVVWELLSDTDHLNRLIGLFPVDFSMPRENTSLFHRRAKAKVFGVIPLNWQEFPFEWEKERYYAVERVYESGPLKRFYGGVELEEGLMKNGRPQTFVRLFADFTARHFLTLPAIPLVGKKSMILTLRYLRHCLKQEEDKGEQISPFSNKKKKINSSLLETRIERLKNAPIESLIINKLERHLLEEHDDRVLNMRAYEWADRWGFDRFQTLRVFIYATKSGLLDLSWSLMCPNCRVTKSRTASLQELNQQVHCDFCGIDYEMSFDQYVEIRFSVNQGIREAVDNVFCLSGPQITPHIEQQVILRKGDRITIPHPLTKGAHTRLRVLQKNWFASSIDIGDTVTLLDDGLEVVPPESPQEERDSLTISHQGNKDEILVVEALAYTDQMTTAQEVTALQEFRDLFTSEVLSPDSQVKVESLTLLFSDLKGSTALYEKSGDGRAYVQVRHHFSLLSEKIRANRGAIVKTIGDAVMAVFYEPASALNAAYEIQTSLQAFNQTNGYEFELKLGLHTGPALAVRSNDHLDYFGRTVNMAARIPGLSEGRDVVLSPSLLEDPLARQALETFDVTQDHFLGEIKGFEEKVPLIRLQFSSNKALHRV